MGGRIDDFTHVDYLDSEQSQVVQNEVAVLLYSLFLAYTFQLRA